MAFNLLKLLTHQSLQIPQRLKEELEDLVNFLNLQKTEAIFQRLHLLLTLLPKTCSDQIVHKIINEKVKNSEKSDKLSIHGDDEGGGNESTRVSNNKSLPSVVLQKFSIKSSRRGARTDGIPLEDRKKRRGRKKELPAIFRKVYGSLADDTSSWGKNNDKAAATKGSSSPSVDNSADASSELQNIADGSKNIHKKKKKKHKQFKSKHKNIVDPAFLSSMEDLLMKMEGCWISKTKVERNNLSGEGSSSILPPIFRVKRGSLLSSVIGGKKRRTFDKRTSDRESGTEGDSSSKEKASGKRKKKQQELPKQVSWNFGTVINF